MQHRTGETTFWGYLLIDPEELIGEFIKASPKRHEIEQIKREREGA